MVLRTVGVPYLTLANNTDYVGCKTLAGEIKSDMPTINGQAEICNANSFTVTEVLWRGTVLSDMYHVRGAIDVIAFEMNRLQQTCAYVLDYIFVMIMLVAVDSISKTSDDVNKFLVY